MALIEPGVWACEECGEPCAITFDYLRSTAWCLQCGTYAEGFDGEAWYYERATSAADALRKRTWELEA